MTFFEWFQEQTCLDNLSLKHGYKWSELQRRICERFSFVISEMQWPNSRLSSEKKRKQRMNNSKAKWYSRCCILLVFTKWSDVHFIAQEDFNRRGGTVTAYIKRNDAVAVASEIKKTANIANYFANRTISKWKAVSPTSTSRLTVNKDPTLLAKWWSLWRSCDAHLSAQELHRDSKSSVQTTIAESAIFRTADRKLWVNHTFRP